jgi:hypothetical protein
MEETKCYCGHTIYCDCGPEILEVPMPIYKKETIEDAAHEYSYGLTNHAFIAGAKWQKEKSEENILWALLLCSNKKFKNSLEVKEWWNNFNGK